MKKIITAALAAILLAPFAYADSNSKFSWGIELQAYPTGVIPGIRYEWQIAENDVIFGRLAYNITERSDNGDHADESGGGLGIGVGWRHWKYNMYEEWHYGVRMDIWSLDIDWKDNVPVRRTGNTDIIVVQPSAELGYSWITSSGSRLDLTAGLGVEVNVDTDGEDVGEGTIALIGLSWMFR